MSRRCNRKHGLHTYRKHLLIKGKAVLDVINKNISGQSSSTHQVEALKTQIRVEHEEESGKNHFEDTHPTWA